LLGLRSFYFTNGYFIAILEAPRQELAEEVGKFSLGFVEVHGAKVNKNKFGLIRANVVYLPKVTKWQKEYQ